jgi:hypothetical protein
VARLAGEPVGPALQDTAGDGAAADARAEGDEHRLVRAARRAEPVLGPRGTGGVVVDDHRDAEASLELTAEREGDDSRKVGTAAEHTLAVDEPRDPEADGVDAVRRQQADGVDDRIHDRRAADGCRDPLLTDDAPAVHHDGEQLRATDVDPHRNGGWIARRGARSRRRIGHGQ